MPHYAEGTTVSSDASRTEIERTLRRYGADQFAYGWDQARAFVGFRIGGRMVRLLVPMPDRNSREFHRTPARSLPRTREQADAAWEQACRQRWRALALVIKAKLEAVTAGISTVEREFLADVVLPSGQTIGAWMEPQIAAVYERGELPTLLPGSSD